MRAIRITEWGGPEVLELVEDAPRPAGRRAPGARRASRARASTSPTPTRARTPTSRATSCRSCPGAEVAGVVEEDGGGFQAGQRVVALVGTGGYAEYVAAPAATTFPIPDGVERRDRARAAAPGPDRLAPVRTSAKLAAGRERRRARRGRRGRLAGGPARQAAGRGPRDRDRLDGGEARARARARRRRRGRRHARGPRRRAGARPTSASASTSCSRWPAARVFDASLEALAPFGRLVDLRDGLARAQRGRAAAR